MSIPVIKPAELSFVAQSYSYDETAFAPLERRLWDRIRAYNGSFGHAMLEHLTRTSIRYGELLEFIGYDLQVATNLALAFRFHDLGKTAQPEFLWGLNDKPDESIKKERIRHAALGVEVLGDALGDFPSLTSHPHIKVMTCLMKYHHERINGKGPEKLVLQALGEAIELAGIVDEVDGKTLARADKAISISNALRDMTALPAYTRRPKHAGEFRLPLLLKAIEYYQKDCTEWIIPRIPSLAPDASDLAFRHNS